jgi:hypothetical protein
LAILFNRKIREWLNRYLLAEIISWIALVIFSLICLFITDNRILIAFLGSIVQTIVYYVYILIKDVILRRKKYIVEGKKYTKLIFLKDIRNLLIEFGPSEILDTLIVRPVALYLGPLLIGNFTIGLLVGSIVADIIYYVPVIILYEFRLKYLKD